MCSEIQVQAVGVAEDNAPAGPSSELRQLDVHTVHHAVSIVERFWRRGLLHRFKRRAVVAPVVGFQK